MQCGRNRKKLYDVDASLTVLIFRDKGLRSIEFGCDFRLPESSGLSRLSKHRDQQFVLLGVK